MPRIPVIQHQKMARGDGGGDADDVSRAEGGGQRGGKRRKGGKISPVLCLGKQGEADRPEKIFLGKMQFIGEINMSTQ